MLLAHVRARHDGTVRMRVVPSPGGTNQVAEVVGWNGYRTCVAVTPRKTRSRAKEEAAHEGEDEEEVKREWGADLVYYEAMRPEADVDEEKVKLDGDLLPSTNDGLLYWPTSDMQHDEYKEVGDSQQPFSTFPSLPSPNASPLLSTSSSFLASYGQSDIVGGGGYFAGPQFTSTSAWSSPPPVPQWQPPRFTTPLSHHANVVPSPMFASPLNSPRIWHGPAGDDERTELRGAGSDADDTSRW